VALAGCLPTAGRAGAEGGADEVDGDEVERDASDSAVDRRSDARVGIGSRSAELGPSLRLSGRPAAAARGGAESGESASSGERDVDATASLEDAMVPVCPAGAQSACCATRLLSRGAGRRRTSWSCVSGSRLWRGDGCWSAVEVEARGGCRALSARSSALWQQARGAEVVRADRPPHRPSPHLRDSCSSPTLARESRARGRCPAGSRASAEAKHRSAHSAVLHCSSSSAPTPCDAVSARSDRN